MNDDDGAKLAACVFGKVGYQLLEWSLFQFHPIEFVVVKKQKDTWALNISKLARAFGVEVVEKKINSNFTRDLLKEKNIDVCLLLWYPDIIKKETIDCVNYGFINLHPSLLRYGYCGGMFPWYWNIIEDVEHGVSIHFINEQIDDGKILWDKKIQKDITDTGETIYTKCREAIIELYKENYKNITELNFNPIDIQYNEKSKLHYAKELNEHSRIDLNKEYKAKDLIDIMRARTFWNGPSSYFEKDGGKYEIRVDIKKCE